MESAMDKELTSKKTQYEKLHSFFHSKANGKTLPFSPPCPKILRTSLLLCFLLPDEGRPGRVAGNTGIHSYED